MVGDVFVDLNMLSYSDTEVTFLRFYVFYIGTWLILGLTLQKDGKNVWPSLYCLTVDGCL